MPRRRRGRGAGGFPQPAGPIEGGGEGDSLGSFPGQPDLGGFGGGGGRAGGINISNINTAIAQAISETGPGGASQGATVSAGGGKKKGGGKTKTDQKGGKGGGGKKGGGAGGRPGPRRRRR